MCIRGSSLVGVYCCAHRCTTINRLLVSSFLFSPFLTDQVLTLTVSPEGIAGRMQPLVLSGGVACQSKTGGVAVDIMMAGSRIGLAAVSTAGTFGKMVHSPC